MNVLVLQHSAHAGPGRLAATLRDHGLKLEISRADQPRSFSNRGVPSDLDDVHALVILGGPQNVTDLAQHAWMRAEVELIRAAHTRELPVIGVCLGHQLIAHALGGEVATREKPIVGFAPMSLTVAGQTETIFAGVQWNSQQFFSCGQQVRKTPAGATVLAGTPRDAVQAFKVGLRTYGFQHHFECDQPMLEALVAHSKPELERAGIAAGEVKVQIDQLYPTYARIADRLCLNIATYCFPAVTRLSA